MYNLSEHTTQVNGWISLTKSRQEFSQTLEDHGYECDFMEKELETGGGISVPDVVLTSKDENHSIVVECKKGGVEKDQHSRYKRLERNSDSLLRASRFNGSLDRAKFASETCYSAFADLSGNSILRKGGTSFVHFQKTTSGILLDNLLKFKSPTVRTAFPINMDPDEQIPVEYYPFDIEQDDDYSEFVSALVQALIVTAIQGGTLNVEEVMEEAHPYWNQLGQKKRGRFIKEGSKVMKILEYRELVGFIENISKSESEWMVHPGTAEAIQVRLDEEDFIGKVAEASLEQTTFDEDDKDDT